MRWKHQPTERSLPCNGELISYFRKQLGWTQQRLADEAGYTKRLIAKAESGASLSPDTIEVLAETLSNANGTVFPEDLASSPKELVTAFLRAFATYEHEFVDHISHFLAEDLEVCYPGGKECAPLSGIYHGIEGFDTLTRKFFEVFQRPDKEVALETAMVTTDGNRALLACFEKLGNKFIPPDAPAGPLVLMMVFARGKIASIQFIFDTVQFGAVLTAWRSGKKGVVSHDDVKYIENPLWNQRSDSR